MAVKVPKAEDTEMNMTPMIDIVFQLIIFFMLQLKFKEIDRQIDSNLPKDRGLAATPTQPPDFQKIKIKVFRREFDKAESEQYTLVKVDNTHEFHLPKGWKGYVVEGQDSERGREYDKRMSEIQGVIKAKYDAQPDKSLVKGEIVAPPPKGGFVPHEDVMRMLDIFLVVGLRDVVFEGAGAPLTNAERAAAMGGGEG
jgi:hypothetical protein